MEHTLERVSCSIPITVSMQQTDYTCGPAVLSSVLFSLLQKEVTELELAIALGTSEISGTSRHAFIETIDNHAELSAMIICQSGVEGSVLQVSQLLNRDHLVAVNYLELTDNEGHWALVEAIDGSTIWLADPIYGASYMLPLAEFLARWRSESLTAAGVPEYKPWISFKKRT